MQIQRLRSRDGRAPAITDPDRGLRWSYDELSERIDRFAGDLVAAGVEPGDRVAIACASRVEATVSFLAVGRAGAVALPFNPALTEPEIRRDLAQLKPSHAVVQGVDACAAVLRAESVAVHQVDATQPVGTGHHPTLPDVDEADLALLLQTSGTTGSPKLVPLTHANISASTATIAQTYGLGADDVSLCLMPLFHVHGLVGACLSTLATGGTAVMPADPRMSRFWQTVRDERATWVSAVPTLLAGIPPGAVDSQLRFLRSASSPLPPTLASRLEGDLGIAVLEAYGMTEASHQIASNPMPPGRREVGSVGRATGTQVRCVDESWSDVPAGDVGEVVVSGTSVTAGYLDNPTANAKAFRAGWFRTGDLGSLTADGYLRLVGRVKEMINRGGEKISPREVDETLLAHPSVVEAAAFGVPDEKYGEAVHAMVVAQPDVSVSALLTHCGERLAAFKVPVKIHVVSAIPKGPTGKVQRSLLSRVAAPR